MPHTQRYVLSLDLRDDYLCLRFPGGNCPPSREPTILNMSDFNSKRRTGHTQETERGERKISYIHNLRYFARISEKHDILPSSQTAFFLWV